ncbi:MAG: aspartate--tRNA ligase, partial [Bartonella sp.]|nr:aspartate--tRNA ligase [Bartonella sp.]
EPVRYEIFSKFSETEVSNTPFVQIPYEQAMLKYGSDKPDLRNPIIMEDVSQHFLDSGFKVFSQILASDQNACVWAIPAKNGGSRGFCDRMNVWAQGEGQPGLGYIFWREENGNCEGAGP